MALAAIQASYDDEEEEIVSKKHKEEEEAIEDQMAVINDPAFSVMSKIKLNLTPAVAIQVRLTSQFLSSIISVRF
jgi:hypothetical protein